MDPARFPHRSLAAALLIGAPACFAPKEPIDSPLGAAPSASAPAREGNPDAYYHFMMANLMFDDGRSSRKDIGGYRKELEKASQSDPDSAFLAYELGNALAAEGQPETALVQFRQAVTLRPDYSPGWFQIARIQLVLGQEGEALEALEKAVLLDPENPLALLKLGQLHHQAGHFDQAEPLYLRYIEAVPEDEQGYFSYAVLRVDQDRAAEAIPFFDRAGEINPYNLNVLKSEADTLAHLGRAEEAALLYKRMLTLNPEDTYALGRLAVLLDRMGREEEAVVWIEQYVRDHPTQYEWSFRLAQIYQMIGRVQDAADMASQLVRAQPATAKYRLLLGAAQLAMDQPDQACGTLDGVAREQGEYHVQAVLQCALIRHQQGRSPESIERLETLVRDGLATDQVYRLLAGLYSETQKETAAFTTLESGLQRFPESQDLIYAYGVRLDASGRNEEAIAQMRKVIVLNPSHAEALNYIGYSYAEQGIHLEEAAELVGRALKVDPAATHILDSMGWVRFRQGRPAEAEPFLRQAAEQSGQDAVIFEHLGDCLVRLGRAEEARDWYRKGVESAVEPADRDRIAGKLQSIAAR